MSVIDWLYGVLTIPSEYKPLYENVGQEYTDISLLPPILILFAVKFGNDGVVVIGCQTAPFLTAIFDELLSVPPDGLFKVIFDNAFVFVTYQEPTPPAPNGDEADPKRTLLVPAGINILKL